MPLSDFACATTFVVAWLLLLFATSFAAAEYTLYTPSVSEPAGSMNESAERRQHRLIARRARAAPQPDAPSDARYA